MNRRDYLKGLMAAGGSLIALPSWAEGWSNADLPNEAGGFFTFSESEMISSITDAIIPTGNSIGANSIGVDKFLEKLLANCYEREIQENIKAQLTTLENSAQQHFSKGFSTCDLKQRQGLLLKFASSEKKEEKDFFDLIKSETIRGFSTSKEVMLNHLHYKPVPGHYYGCVDVKA